MILVTGGTGFIGSPLVEKLVSRGENVRALVRRRSSFGNLRVDVVRGDLVTGAGLPQALDGVETVLHLAGVTKALSVRDYYEGNVRATENLARAVAGCGRPVRMVHISSLAAIGPSPDGTPVSEDDEPHPLSNYGKSKLEGEKAVRAILPDAVIIRPPVVYGPRDTDVFQLLKSINRSIVVRIAGGERWFSAIYVGDLVDGILAAATTPKSNGRAYFLAYPQAASWGELEALAAKIMGRIPRVVTVPVAAAPAVGYCAEVWSRITRKPGIVSREKIDEAQCSWWVCDTRRAKEEIGFEAPTDLGEGLARTLGWYREVGWLKY